MMSAGSAKKCERKRRCPLRGPLVVYSGAQGLEGPAQIHEIFVLFVVRTWARRVCIFMRLEWKKTCFFWFLSRTAASVAHNGLGSRAGCTLPPEQTFSELYKGHAAVTR